MKVMVKYNWLDDYGFVRTTEYVWTDTKEEADAWIADMKKRNGGYIRIVEVREADYTKYLEMLELEAKKAEIEQKIEELKKLL